MSPQVAQSAVGQFMSCTLGQACIGIFAALASSFIVSHALVSQAFAADGKLLGTGGLLSLDGSGGGGISPWASLATYAEEQQIGVSAGYSQAQVDDYQLRALSANVNVYNRVELSIAQQNFDFDASNVQLGQRIVGAKVRVYGDLIYQAAQISVGLAHKTHTERADLTALGVDRSSGTDYYLSIGKLWLDGPFGRNFLLNGTLRNTNAQQTGLLGFSEQRDWQAEVSTALLLNRRLAIGAEYKSKPDRLAGIPEEAWKDFFIAYFPNKHLTLALAYVDLGSIGGKPDQNGVYLTLQGTF
jgi:hypothetical protein